MNMCVDWNARDMIKPYVNKHNYDGAKNNPEV